MIFYQWDEQGLYVGETDVDETGALPLRSTPTKPMKLTGAQVARWTGGGWEKLAAVPIPESVQLPDWSELIAARRFQVETGGVTVADVQINTDRDSQSLLTGAAFAASLDPEYRIKWKAATGFVDLTGEQILGIASEVRAFVQSCFDRESELLNEVKNGTIELSMLETGWPG
nr:DUF4376 domain-containing protein [uncultured Pseudomonas sp.]